MKMEKENSPKSNDDFPFFSLPFISVYSSSTEIDERKRSSATHRTYGTPSVRRDKERTFSSCKSSFANFVFLQLISVIDRST